MNDAHHIDLDRAVETELLGDARHLVGGKHNAETKKHVIRESEQTEEQQRCLAELERLVQADIAADLPVEYADENHIAVGGRVHECSGPRTHVSATGRIHGFRLYPKLVYDVQQNRYLLIGFVGEGSEEALRNFRDSLEGNPVRRSLAFF